METINERELGWDETIQKDSAEFVLLPEGDYKFTVESFERSRSGGSEKLPPCNMAMLKLRIETPEGSASIKHNLILHTKMEWALSAFFTAIGQKKKGEKLQMNWQKVPGSCGRCKLGIKKYDGKEYNEIKQFLKPETQGYTPGSF